MEDGNISFWVAAAGAILFVFVTARLSGRTASPSAPGDPLANAGEPKDEDESLDELPSADQAQAEDSPSFSGTLKLATPAPLPDFIGRAAEVRALRELLENHNSALIVPEGGRRGLGATELALSVAADLEQVYPDGRIALDLDAPPNGPLNSEQAISRVLQALEPHKTPATDSARLREQYGALLASKRVLIVADNARDPRQVEGLTPPAPSALLAVASRSFEVGLVKAVPLGPLESDEAEHLLNLLFPCESSSREAVEKLLGFCRGDPLSLRLAGGQLLASKSQSVEAYVERLEKRAGSESEGSIVALDAAQQITIGAPARAARWGRLSVFPAAFDRTAGEIVAQLEKGDFEDLVARNLLRYDPVEERACLHELLSATARNIALPAELAIVEQRHAEYYLQVAIDAERNFAAGGDARIDALSSFDRDRPHIETGQAWAARHAETDHHAAALARDYALGVRSILDRRLSHRERAPWFEIAVKASQELGDAKAERSAAETLGKVRAAMGDLKAAIRSYNQALTVARDSGNRRTEAHILFEEALAFGRLGTSSEALSRAGKALTIMEEIGDPKTDAVRRKIEEWKGSPPDD